MSTIDLLASGFTPTKQSVENRIRQLENENNLLKGQLKGYEVLSNITERKNAECNEWKERALAAEKRLELTSSIASSLTTDNNTLQHDASSDQETDLQSLIQKNVELRGTDQVDGRENLIGSLSLQAVNFKDEKQVLDDEMEVLRLQARQYCKDFETKRADCERFKAKCKTLQRNYNFMRTERDVALKQLREIENEVYALRRDNRRNTNQPVFQMESIDPKTSTSSLSTATDLTTPVDRSWSRYWSCSVCTLDNPATRTSCEACASVQDTATRFEADSPLGH